jgi:alpha-1,3-rhamnosyltransferase
MSESHEQPLVSIIISSYNHAAYIESCINSVLAQTYPNIELLVVDDGSSDGSVDILRRLQAQHGFDFRVQANQGLARTLNDLIARARGNLIAPLGSDDEILPERIAKQVTHLQGKPEVGLCASNMQFIDGNGAVVEKRFRQRELRRLNFENMFLGDIAGPPAPTLLFRREALEQVGGFDPSIRLEDLLVELKITHAGWFIDVLPDVLARYRVHESNTYKNRRFMVENVLKTYAQFAEHPAYDEVCARFRNSMLMKCASNDAQLFKELLRDMPLKYWNGKTLRALGRRCIGIIRHAR